MSDNEKVFNEPVPVPTKVIAIIKSMFNIDSDVEASRPAVVRKLYDTLEGSLAENASKVEKEDRQIIFDGITVNISILRPANFYNKTASAEEDHAKLPVILFLHGGGWMFGSYNSHSILVNELVNLIPACVVFVHYSLTPEARYPIALKECYATLCWIQQHAADIDVDASRLIVAGDSAGGNLSAALTILAKQHQNNGITFQILYYPVVNTDFHNGSYNENKDDAFLPRKMMEYVWNAYCSQPKIEHQQATCVPMVATRNTLETLPPALVITAERDVLRDEGELYAKKLSQAGVPVVSVRYLGVGHGFLTMPTLRDPAKAAIAQTVYIIQKHLKDKDISTISSLPSRL